MSVIDTLLELAQVHKVVGINHLPGAYELQIDDTWYLAINGHETPITVDPKGCMEAEIPPWHFAVWYNGWIAGIFHPLRGGEFADGTGANLETFSAAIEAHLDEIKGSTEGSSVSDTEEESRRT